jgi:serine/threonine-protein kinase
LPDTVAEPRADGARLAPGTRLGDRFEILGWLGAGGFGAVYKARDRQLNDVVALKTLRETADLEAALEGLKNELRIARRITHRNVLRTHDFGEADGVAFVSMEFVRGITVRELLDHARRPPVSVALRLGRQVAAGIEAAHVLGVIHGDIKPENLIVDATGLLKIMDFGIARMVRRTRPVEDGMVWGTPGYLAPEQLKGDPGDVRSDIYGCGAVLYELFAGRRPFLAANVYELSFRVMNEDPPDLGQAAPELSGELVTIVMRCLARDPAARFAGAGELRQALERVAA